MKSGLKGASAGPNDVNSGCSNLCRDEKRTERIVIVNILPSPRTSSNLCRDEKRTESNTNAHQTHRDTSSNLCRDEKRTESNTNAHQTHRDTSSNLCRDEKRTESTSCVGRTERRFGSSECRDEKRSSDRIGSAIEFPQGVLKRENRGQNLLSLSLFTRLIPDEKDQLRL